MGFDWLEGRRVLIGHPAIFTLVALINTFVLLFHQFTVRQIMSVPGVVSKHNYIEKN